MSPNPGEEGHEERGWTHAICVNCWNTRKPDRTTDVYDPWDDEVRCCYCYRGTGAGIYIRQAASEVHGLTEGVAPHG